jgi:predicted enzyme related to lactoylglutathione lyase
MQNELGFDGGLTCAMQCTDLDTTAAWYRTHLGFGELYRVADMGWAEFQTPVTRVNVGFSQVDEPEVKGGATLTFGVSDIDISRATLEAKGVRFDGETISLPGMVRLATFYDPDGNKLMLYQDLSGQS